MGKANRIRSRMLLPEMNYDAACKSSMPDWGKAIHKFHKPPPKHGGGYIAYGDFLLGHHDETERWNNSIKRLETR